MNENRVDCEGRIQQRNGLNGDFNSEFGHRSCQYFEIKQAWNMGVGGGGGAEQPPHIGPAKPSISIMSGFELPTSAFYTTERVMGFPYHHSQVNSNNNPLLSSPFSKIHDLELPLYQSPRENPFLEHSPHQADPNVELSDTLQAMVKSPLNGNQYCGSPEKPNKIPCGNLPIGKLLPIEQHKLFNIDDAGSGRTRRNQRVGCGSYNLPVSQLSFSSQQEKLCPTISAASASTTGNPTSGGTIISSKTRIRWTQDLHEKFVECVNRLGGAEKATPKAILRLMDSDGLTIFHVKSHLQKYRIARYMPDSAQGKSDKRSHVEGGYHNDVKTGLQIREALQLQLDVQRRLHEQLEIQRKLQLRIEEQGKQLRMMFDQQQKSSNNLLSAQNLGIAANDDTSVGLKEAEVSTSEGSGNSFFPSKIS